MKKDFSFDFIKNVYEKKSYVFFEKGLYNLNVFGIRANNIKANSFDDLVCLAYIDEKGKQVKTFDATTDPGTYYLKDPCHSLRLCNT